MTFITQTLIAKQAIRRSDIARNYSMSLPQASNDFATYQKLCPGCIAYDVRAKAYVPTDRFVKQVQVPGMLP